VERQLARARGGVPAGGDRRVASSETSYLAAAPPAAASDVHPDPAARPDGAAP